MSLQRRVRPPHAAENFEALFAERPAPLLRIAERLREMIYDVLPNANEWVGRMQALYMAPRVMCGIRPGPEWVAFSLPRGKELEDPRGLLEGSGRGTRHVKVRGLDPDLLAELERMLRENIRLVRRR